MKLTSPIISDFWPIPWGNRGNYERAIEVLDDAFVLVEQTDERFYESELWRLRGVLLGRNSAKPHEHEAQVRHCFQRASAIAKGQEARSFELRAALSLARLDQELGTPIEESVQNLTRILATFTEGSQTPDLMDARKWLSAS